ncbi:MAG: hypothetical protein AAF961_03265, partial [Planctomycetota bacterium]
MGDLIKRRLALLADETEPWRRKNEDVMHWKKAHDEVVPSFDHTDHLRDVVQYAIFCYEFLKARIRSGEVDAFDMVITLYNSLQRWYESVSGVVDAVEKSAADGYSVDRAQERIDVHCEAGALLV